MKNLIVEFIYPFNVGRVAAACGCYILDLGFIEITYLYKQCQEK